jgi:hypothetical protein
MFPGSISMRFQIEIVGVRVKDLLFGSAEISAYVL